jgi:Ca-activated chloride channel homolog
MQTARQDERRFTVMLPADTLPNKDFVLRYSVASGAVQPVAWVSAEAGVETMLLTLLPPRLTDDIAPEPREFIFVVDRSGSMNGGPLEQAKNALRACLRAMNPTDSFTIQAFDDKIEWFDPRPQSVTQETVNRADKWLDTIHSRGGTEIVPAITAALSISADAARQRYVVFLTDGAVSAEEQAQANVKKLRGTARLFTFGIGSSVNRALLAKMAEVGRGIAEFLQLHEDIETAITRFQDRVSYPVLQDLVLEWQNAETWDVYPATLPDLYVGQALELVARLKRKDASADVTLHVTGKRRGQPVTVNAAIPITTYTDPALTRVWARARVDALMDQPHSDSTRQQIISLAIDHRLVTPFTAFVAVDSETVQNADGSPRKVAVSVPLPEGVDFDTKVRGVFGFAASTPLSSIVLGGRSMPVAPAPAGMPRAKSPLPDIDVPSFLRRVVSSVRPDAKKRADTNQLSKMMPPPADEEMMLEEAADTPLLTSIPEIIKWLARTQNLSGSWGGGADEAEQTAAALLAFVRAGHTTRAGNYRAQVRKAADWLKAATLTGFAAALRWRALHELDTAQNTTAYAFPAPQPNSDAERAALDDSAAITLPAQVTTLDGLRITAIRAGAATPEDALLNDHAQQALIQTWLAVGKPNTA